MIPLSHTDFTFSTDAESLEFFRQIVETMMRSFGITREECVGRINQAWSHVRAVVGEDEIYREFPAYWANHFIFGKQSFWWIPGAIREKQGMPPLKPLPYPKS